MTLAIFCIYAVDFAINAGMVSLPLISIIGLADES